MKISVLLFALILGFSVSGNAQAIESNPLPQKYDSLENIPDPLRKLINQSTRYPEQYISRVLTVIREIGRTGDQIDLQDIIEYKEERLNERRRSQLTQTLSYDRNLDGKVKREEIAQSLVRRKSIHSTTIAESERAAQVEATMQRDANKDGVLTIDEMATLPPEGRDRLSGRHNEAEAFLKIDPNADGRLTIAELTDLAQKSFNTVDIDNNGTLSPDESSALQKLRNEDRQTAEAVSDSCKFPIPNPDERVVFLGVYEGNSVSTVSVAGQTEATTVLPVLLNKGVKKTYLIASSFDPVIWQLRGDKEQISRAVVIGPSGPREPSGEAKIQAGIIGLDSDKISFKSTNDCGLKSSFEDNELKQAVTKGRLRKLLGRDADLFFAQYNPSIIHVHNDHVNTDMADAFEKIRKFPPKGYDIDVWENHVRLMPGGVLDVSKEKVVSDAPSDPYQVLPYWAGLAKLTADGSIIPLGGNSNEGSYVVTRESSVTGKQERAFNLQSDGQVKPGPGLKIARFFMPSGFKVVKNIPYYPAGLAGAHSTKFLIAKGVTPPKGDLAHSCAVIEETGEILPARRNRCD